MSGWGRTWPFCQSDDIVSVSLETSDSKDLGREMEDIDTELARRDQSWGGRMSEINYRMKKTLQVDKLKQYFITQSSYQNNVIK